MKSQPMVTTDLSHGLLVFVLFFLFLMISQSGFTQNWQLVWSDEFTNSIGPDWVFETGTGSGGWGNNELQYYRQQNASIENGQLVITAKQENFGGMNYTSARMKTQGKKSWKYGKIEARIAMPSFQGVWPAFWMLGDNITSVGWPACGEIDIMEHVNTEQATHGTIHWQDHTNSYASYSGSTYANVTAYHTYAIEWDANSIKWYLDGNQYHEASIAGGVNGTSEFHNNFFIILNMAIGGNWPGWNVDNSALPAKMYVDYVRVYEPSGPAWSQQIEAENYSIMSGVQTENCSEGGQNVGWIDANDWMVWDVNLPSSGSYLVEYRVASLYGGGGLQLEKAGGSPVYGALSVPNTSGWQNWTTISHTVNLNADQQQIAIKATSGGWNINWLKLTQATSSRISTPQPETTSNTISLYPNPAGARLYLKGLTTRSSYAIYNLSGRLILKGNMGGDSLVAIDVSDLKPGAYLLKCNELKQAMKFYKK